LLSQRRSRVVIGIRSAVALRRFPSDKLHRVIARDAFRVFVVEALRSLGGAGSVLDVTKHVWQVHEQDLRQSGDLFFTWQYDVRWAAQYLRNNGYMKAVDGDRRAPWALTESGWKIELDRLSVSARQRAVD
jgi:hypothetical protein